MKSKFNFQKFEKGLEEYKKDGVPTENHHGLAKVIGYVWNHYPTREVDFNAFSYEDILSAINELYNIPIDDDFEDHTELDTNSLNNNPWVINAMIENLVAGLCHTKDKVYVNDDDFI